MKLVDNQTNEKSTAANFSEPVPKTDLIICF